MKLLFPHGEHSPITLREGITKIGSAPECDVVLAAPGIAPMHCEIDLSGQQATLRVTDNSNVVVVNGRQISQPAILKAGDLVLFAKVGARISALEVMREALAAPTLGTVDEDLGATRVRQALPKYMLRGVSGVTFGKTFALYGSMSIGRHSECDICVPTDEVSRKHAKLQVMADGVMVEDLGSANGTFVAGKRLQRPELMKGGDELRLDTIRFMLMSPGMEVPSAALNKQDNVPTKTNLTSPNTKSKKSPIALIVIGFLLMAAVIGGLKYSGLI